MIKNIIQNVFAYVCGGIIYIATLYCYKTELKSPVFKLKSYKQPCIQDGPTPQLKRTAFGTIYLK